MGSHFQWKKDSSWVTKIELQVCSTLSSGYREVSFNYVRKCDLLWRHYWWRWEHVSFKKNNENNLSLLEYIVNEKQVQLQEQLFDVLVKHVRSHYQDEEYCEYWVKKMIKMEVNSSPELDNIKSIEGRFAWSKSKMNMKIFLSFLVNIVLGCFSTFLMSTLISSSVWTCLRNFPGTTHTP